jgi:hypothetical protein
MSLLTEPNEADASCPEVSAMSAKPNNRSRVYETRLIGNHVRLLQVVADSANAPLRCDLIDVSIDHPPPYEALSYVWGDASVTEPLVCNGEILQITTNLAKALKRIRSGISNPQHRDGSKISHRTEASLSPIMLWIDAICINQTDVIERNHQVSRMGSIYSRAQRVIVWLGDTETKVDQVTAVRAAVEVFELLLLSQARYERSSALQFDVSPKAFEELWSRRGYVNKDEAWASLRPLFTSSWFSRIWCVQEVVLARDTTILFDFGEVSLSTFRALARWLLTLCIAYQGSPPHLKDVMMNATQAHNSMGEANVAETDILAFVNAYGELSATNPRDKIYALLGLVNENVLDVDYGKSILEVYSTFTLRMLHRGLQILSHVYHNIEFERLDEFPSWVPRFDNNPPTTRLYDYSRDNGLSRRRQRPTLDLNLAASGMLRMSGLLCDAISSADYIHFDPKHVTCGKNVSTGQDFLEFLRGLWCVTQPLDSAGNLQDLRLAYSLGLTLTGGHMGPFAMVDDQDVNSQALFLRNFLATMRQYFPGEIDGINFEGTNVELFCHTMMLYCHDRRIFVTKKGWVGLGPRCMRPGDVLVVLDGGPMPYILRPTGDGDQYWFMGECYVSIIARGEVYDVIGQEGIEERVFDMV